MSAPTGNAILGRASSTANTDDDDDDDDDDDNAGALAFSASAVSVDENAGMLTVNNSSLAGSDYTATAGDLSWSAGDSANKTLTIPIVRDSLAERSENFRVELSAPVGGARLNNPKIQRVTIVNLPR